MEALLQLSYLQEIGFLLRIGFGICMQEIFLTKIRAGACIRKIWLAFGLG